MLAYKFEATLKLAPLVLSLSACYQGAETESSPQIDRAQRVEGIEMMPDSEYRALRDVELFSASRVLPPSQNVSARAGALEFDVPVELLSLPQNPDYSEGSYWPHAQKVVSVIIAWPFLPEEGATRGSYTVTSPDQFVELVDRGHLSPTGYILDMGQAADELQFFTLGGDARRTLAILNEGATVQCRNIAATWEGGDIVSFHAPNPFFQCDLTKWDSEFQIYFEVPGYLYREIGNIAQEIERIALAARNSEGD